MNLLQDLLEALKPSQYRQYVKSWNKNRYVEMFSKYTTDKKGYRIYIPLKGQPKKVDPDPEVEAAVKAAGYEIEDYLTGIASKDEGKRKIKIGKLLKDPKLQQKFANDPKRASVKNVENYVVISRHPYDIAGMSTDRGWKSCMNLKDGINRHYVAIDVAAGTLVAYLINANDKNINRPIARVLIKPFVNVDGNAPDDNKIAFGVEDHVYGTPMSGFKETVLKWVDEVNDDRKLDGIFSFHHDLYNDSGKDRIGVGPTGKLYQMIKDDWTTIEKIENPSQEVIEVAIEQSNGLALSKLKHVTAELAATAAQYLRYLPTRDLRGLIRELEERHVVTPEIQEKIIAIVPLAAVMFKNVTDDELYHVIISNGDHVYEAIENPSEALRLALVEHDPNYIRLMKDPSEKIQNAAIDRAIHLDQRSEHTMKTQHVLELIQRTLPVSKKISKEVLHKAIDLDHDLIHFIASHHLDDEDEVASKAFDKNVNAFKKIKNPTKEQCERAIDGNSNNIQYIKNPSIELQLRAVKKNGYALKHLDDPSDAVIDAAIEQDPSSIRYAPSEYHSEERHHKFLDHNHTLPANIRAMGREYLKNATPAIQMKAVKQHHEWIKYFSNPAPEAQMEVLKADINQMHHIMKPSEEAMLYVVDKSPKSQLLGYVEHFVEQLTNLPRAVMKAILEKDGEMIDQFHEEYDRTRGMYVVPDLDDDLVRVAMKTYPRAVTRLKDPTTEDLEEVLKKNPQVFKELSNDHHHKISDEMKVKFLKKDGSLFGYLTEDDLKNPKYQIAAIKSDPYSTLAAIPHGEIGEKVALLAASSPAVGDIQTSCPARYIMRFLMTHKVLTPEIMKILVTKDHDAYAPLMKSKASWITKLLTPELKRELRELATAGKKAIVARQQKLKELYRQASKPSVVSNKLEATAGEFITKHDSNDDHAETFYSAAAHMKNLIDNLINNKIEINKILKMKFKDNNYLLAFNNDEPIAWVDASDQYSYDPTVKPKRKRKKITEQHLTTFKDLLQFSMFKS